jgi:hypothetical protein
VAEFLDGGPHHHHRPGDLGRSCWVCQANVGSVPGPDEREPAEVIAAGEGSANRNIDCPAVLWIRLAHAQELGNISASRFSQRHRIAKRNG